MFCECAIMITSCSQKGRRFTEQCAIASCDVLMARPKPNHCMSLHFAQTYMNFCRDPWTWCFPTHLGDAFDTFAGQQALEVTLGGGVVRFLAIHVTDKQTDIGGGQDQAMWYMTEKVDIIMWIIPHPSYGYHSCPVKWCHQAISCNDAVLHIVAGPRT